MTGWNDGLWPPVSVSYTTASEAAEGEFGFKTHFALHPPEE